MIELKSCPFCGSGAYVTYRTNDRFLQDHYVLCRNNKCRAGVRDQSSQEATIAAWNRRASAPAAGSGPKDHEVAATVNKLRDIAVEFHDSQQLRERIADVVRALLAQYGAPQDKEDAERWKPIETAPLTEEIWAYNGEQGRMIWSEGTDWALWVWSDELMADVDPSPDQPTHWMPLPPAPQEGR